MRKKAAWIKQTDEGKELKSRAAQFKKGLRKFQAETKRLHLATEAQHAELTKEHADRDARMKQVRQRFLQSPPRI